MAEANVYMRPAREPGFLGALGELADFVDVLSMAADAIVLATGCAEIAVRAFLASRYG